MFIRLLTLLIVAVALRADSISVTASENCVSGPGVYSAQCAVYPSPDWEVVFEVPQTTASLSSVTWTFSDSESVKWGWNDMYEQAGLPFTTTLSAEASSDELGGAIGGSTVTLNEVTTGTHDLTNDPLLYTTTLSGSGTVADPSVFEGTGLYTITVQFSAEDDFTAYDSVIAGLSDNATLTLDYVDPPAVPEPKWAVLAAVGVLMGATWAARRVRRTVLPIGGGTQSRTRQYGTGARPRECAIRRANAARA